MKYRTFHPHLHNNNRTRPGLPLHAWVASAETAEPDEDGDGAESRDTLLASWIREQGCRKQMSSLLPLRASSRGSTGRLQNGFLDKCRMSVKSLAQVLFLLPPSDYISLSICDTHTAE